MPLQDLVPYSPNLQVLNYPRYCSDEFLRSLAKYCHGVLEIDINGSIAVTDAGIKRLCTKEDGESTGLKLRKLFLNDCGFSDDTIAYFIKHVPTLEVIDHYRLPGVLYAMHVKDLLQIDSVQPYNLQKLNLLVVHPDILKICSSLCPHLKIFSFPIWRQEDLRYLYDFSEFEELHLRNRSGSNVEINELLELRGKLLRVLSVSNVSLSYVTLANCCPLLKELNLCHCNLKIDGVVNPHLFSSLSKCWFQDFEAESAEAIGQLLRSSPKLVDVCFSYCDLNSSEMKAEVLECKNRPIRKFTFSGPVDKAFVQDILLNVHSLRSMTVKDYHLKEIEMFEIKKMAESLPNKPEIKFIAFQYGFC